MSTADQVTKDEWRELLPWQRAVLRLHNEETMDYGSWTWRQYLLPDETRRQAEGLLMMQVALVRAGEEFSVSVWRPTRMGTPADHRLALVTWGEFLDMTREELYDRMNAKYSKPKP